jgi:DNA processing protein
VQDTDPSAHSPQDGLDGWLRLEQVAGVGPLTAALLLERFTTPHAIFNASHATLAGEAGAAVASALLAPPPPSFAAMAGAVRAWRATPGNHVLTLADPAYPALLRQIPAAPILLYAKGNPALLSGPAIAIVGSRSASAQGRANAAAFARAFSGAGMAVVSGMALGIDAAAHEGALEGPGGTVAVLGTGIDRVYPNRHRALAHRIAAQGCLLSEFPLGYPVRSENFPRRNRLISGLCRATVVVEAALKSGSLITARFANEQGRDVFAVPGSIHSPLARGCHALIREGTRLADSAADVLGELALGSSAPGAPPGPPLAPAQALLLDALGFDAIDAGSLAGLTDSEVGALQARLLALELAGHVERLPGGLYQRLIR